MNNEIKKIIVVFKTHLDIGFTDFADTVTREYMENYLPGAMKLARQMRGEKERFIWTTGSWLIQKYLEEGKDRELLEDAIRHGEIRWHGLPFTTHTELFDRQLLEYGLNISEKLDKYFGMQTTAAKLTDVPGHTKALIAPLYKAGIRFLHIGVNPASTPPAVPNLFRWSNSEGEEIVVMYHRNYGEMSRIGDSNTAVYFAHTGDNSGPQSAAQIRQMYQKLHEEYPQAEVIPGTLEDVAQIALQQEMPVITEEIGDTWIHGAGTDPGKISQYRALLRLKNQFPKQEMEKMYKKLILIPEHTWGLDEKVHLGFLKDNGEPIGEHQYFSKKEFQRMKVSEKFQKMELSWREQRQYLTEAVEALSPEVRVTAQNAMQEYKRVETNTDEWEEKRPLEIISLEGYTICVTEKGEIVFLSGNCQDNNFDKHPSEYPSVGFMYEIFSHNEYERFRSQYVVSDETWALEDFGKIGLEKEVKQYHKYEPCKAKVWVKGNQLVVKMELLEEAVLLYGGMNLLEMKAEFYQNRIDFDFAWFGKEESRIPEASWIRIDMKDRIQSIRKLGKDIRPDLVVSGGNRRMHAVDEVQMENTVFTTLDAPLISIEKPGLLNFDNQLPDLTAGFYLNLHNNVWGTNFPMWYGEDARFRFTIESKNNNEDGAGRDTYKI